MANRMANPAPQLTPGHQLTPAPQLTPGQPAIWHFKAHRSMAPLAIPCRITGRTASGMYRIEFVARDERHARFVRPGKLTPA